jgi:hypothetical protein
LDVPSVGTVIDNMPTPKKDLEPRDRLPRFCSLKRGHSKL